VNGGLQLGAAFGDAVGLAVGVDVGANGGGVRVVLVCFGRSAEGAIEGLASALATGSAGSTVGPGVVAAWAAGGVIIVGVAAGALLGGWCFSFDDRADALT
jgi:hypothetical protein